MAQSQAMLTHPQQIWLASIVLIFASYAFLLILRFAVLQRNKWALETWCVAAAAVLAGGTWVAHFIAALAYVSSADSPTNSVDIVLSFFPGVVASWFVGKAIIGRKLNISSLLKKGVVIGLLFAAFFHATIEALHYSGSVINSTSGICLEIAMPLVLGSVLIYVGLQAQKRKISWKHVQSIGLAVAVAGAIFGIDYFVMDAHGLRLGATGADTLPAISSIATGTEDGMTDRYWFLLLIASSCGFLIFVILGKIFYLRKF
ncbi:MAG TPA: hypothetical protein VIE65_01380, partial [Methylobacter sp.]